MFDDWLCMFSNGGDYGFDCGFGRFVVVEGCYGCVCVVLLDYLLCCGV